MISAFLLAIVALGQSAAAPPPDPLQSGKYVIFQAGKQIGSETFAHATADGRDVWSGALEIETLGVKLRQSPKLVLGPAGKPVTLDISFAVNDKEGTFHFEFGDTRYTVSTSGSVPEEHPLPPDAVILSNNVVHHNILLARRYDWRRGGRQEFTALPNTSVVLEARPEEEFRLAGKPLRLRRLFVTIAGTIGANLWLDTAGAVVKMDIPLQRAEIFLEGFEPLEAVTERSSKPAGIDALDVEYASGDHRMAGTLTLPANRPQPLPAVILISGSGPQNRDEDSEGVGGLKLGLFRTIAEKLSSNGIAVLRYDDRGVGKSGGNFPTANMTDFESDARAALAYLKSRPEVDPARLGIIGHSEGSILGARIAASMPELRTLVLMAGTAENGKSILRWQAQMALGSSRFSDLERKRAVDDQEEFFALVAKADSDVAEVQGQRISIRWFKEFLTYEPLDAVRRLRCRVAVMQGGQDVQVPPADAEAIARALSAASTDHEVKVFPRLGHLFTESNGEGIAELADNRKEIAPEVLDYLVGFLGRKL